MAEHLTAPGLLAARARLAEGGTITATTHLAGGSHVDAPPRLGLAGVVGQGGWRPAITVSPHLLSALLGDPDTPIGERLDAVAQARGRGPPGRAGAGPDGFARTGSGGHSAHRMTALRPAFAMMECVTRRSTIGPGSTGPRERRPVTDLAGRIPLPAPAGGPRHRRSR